MGTMVACELFWLTVTVFRNILSFNIRLILSHYAPSVAEMIRSFEKKFNYLIGIRTHDFPISTNISIYGFNTFICERTRK
jgi:hypothetical protein